MNNYFKGSYKEKKFEKLWLEERDVNGEENVKWDLKDIEKVGLGLINLAQNEETLLAVVSTGMKLCEILEVSWANEELSAETESCLWI